MMTHQFGPFCKENMVLSLLIEDRYQDCRRPPVRGFEILLGPLGYSFPELLIDLCWIYISQE
jgi:hypothetical protein